MIWRNSVSCGDVRVSDLDASSKFVLYGRGVGFGLHVVMRAFSSIVGMTMG